MTVARLRLASVLVVVARWSTDLDVIFISGVYCTAMIEDGYIESFSEKNIKQRKSRLKPGEGRGSNEVVTCFYVFYTKYSLTKNNVQSQREPAFVKSEVITMD